MIFRNSRRSPDFLDRRVGSEKEVRDAMWLGGFFVWRGCSSRVSRVPLSGSFVSTLIILLIMMMMMKEG